MCNYDLPPGGFHGPVQRVGLSAGLNPGPGPIGHGAFNPGPGPVGHGAYNPGPGPLGHGTLNPGPWPTGYTADAHPPPAPQGYDAQNPPPRIYGHAELHPPPWRWSGVDPNWVYCGADSLLATAMRKVNAKLGPSPDPRATPTPAVHKKPLATRVPLWRWDAPFRQAALLTQLHGRVRVEARSLWLLDGSCSSGSLSCSLVHEVVPPGANFDYDAQIEMVVRAAAEREDRLPEILSQADDVLPFFDAVSGLNRWASPLLTELLALAWQWETQLVMELKNEIAEQRPHVRSTLVQPVIATPGHGSLPSGHATVSALFAVLLGALCERLYSAAQAQHRVQRLDALARRIAFNRVVAGVHFQMDSLAGYHFGRSLGHLLLALAGHSRSVLGAQQQQVKPNDALAEAMRASPAKLPGKLLPVRALPEMKLLWDAVVRELELKC